MDSSSKSRATLPCHVLNGASQPLHGSLSLRKASVNAEERNRLTASIHSSNTGRQPIDLNAVDGHRLEKNPDDSEAKVNHYTNLDVSPRDPRDEATNPPPFPRQSRPGSPFTLNPPIDFDGLSWPSEFRSAIME